MTDPTDMLDTFRASVSNEIRMESEGMNRFRVFSPFMFDDGDNFAIVLRSGPEGWELSDEGHTFMHLSYDIDERDLRQGTRQKVITNALSMFEVQDKDGELVLPFSPESGGDALYSFVQALLRVADVTYLSRERVRSTFLEDFEAFMRSTVEESRLAFSWSDPSKDPDGLYPVDCHINGMPKPLLVFALPSDNKVSVATIALHQFERWAMPHHSLGIFEEQEAVNRKVLARFTDVCDKGFSSLTGNQARIETFLAEVLAH